MDKHIVSKGASNNPFFPYEHHYMVYEENNDGDILGSRTMKIMISTTSFIGKGMWCIFRLILIIIQAYLGLRHSVKLRSFTTGYIAERACREEIRS
jgi:hypothetical protein